MQNLFNFDKTLSFLMALTPRKPPVFVLCDLIKFPNQSLRYLLQTFMWFSIVNTPVKLVTLNIALF